MRPTLLVPVLALLAACNGDPDGDGLLNDQEAELGTDPNLPDSDGDGLTDKEEVDLGTNPLSGDTDRDGMKDGDEILYGFDPFDDASDGYRGGWPMQEVAVKEAIEGKGKSGKVIAQGKRFKRVTYKDQFGDEVDLYDFAGHGRKVIVDVSAQWCGPCKQLSTLMGSGATVDDLVGGGWPQGDAEKLAAVIEAVEAGYVSWVTILSEDNAYAGATVKTSKAWEAAYPIEGVPVLADTGKDMIDVVLAATGNAFPSLVLLNESMTVMSFGASLQAVLDFSDKVVRGGGGGGGDEEE